MAKSRGNKVHDPRRISRLQTNIDCQFDFRGAHYKALIMDLSLKGAFLSSSFQPPIGGSIVVTIKSAHLSQPLIFEGKVKRGSGDLWTHGSGGQFGIELSSPPLDLAQLINTLISQKSAK
jgi:hypothetical protein